VGNSGFTTCKGRAGVKPKLKLQRTYKILCQMNLNKLLKELSTMCNLNCLDFTIHFLWVFWI